MDTIKNHKDAIAIIGVIVTLQIAMWVSLDNRIDRIEIRLDRINSDLGNRIDRINDRIDRHLENYPKSP